MSSTSDPAAAGPVPARRAAVLGDVTGRTVRLSAVRAHTRAEGPGARAAIWLQGCSVRCPGCFNPHTWDAAGGTVTGTAELVRQLATYDGIEGLTLLGGEPFDQPAGAAALAEGARALGLSVMVFTGYLLEQLAGRPDAGSARLLAATDLLVDGPYVAGLPELSRPWVGSTNQRFHLLTDRYAATRDSWLAGPDRLEVRLRSDGSVAVNGFATDEQLDVLLEGLRRQPRGGRTGHRP